MTSRSFCTNETCASLIFSFRTFKAFWIKFKSKLLPGHFMMGIFLSLRESFTFLDHSGATNCIRVYHVFLQKLDVMIPIHVHILWQEVESIPHPNPTEKPIFSQQQCAPLLYWCTWSHIEVSALHIVCRLSCLLSLLLLDQRTFCQSATDQFLWYLAKTSHLHLIVSSQ